MPRKKPALVEKINAVTAPVIIDADADAALRLVLQGGERSRQVVDLTRRALTMRANGLTDAQIAQNERVQESTLTAWLNSPRRAPSQQEAQRIIDHELKPLAVESTMFAVLAGDRQATRQVMKDTQALKPAKSVKSSLAVIVGVGDGPIGSDPAQQKSAS